MYVNIHTIPGSTLAVLAILFFDFGLVSAISRPFLPLCIVFGPLTTATSCQDADLFSRYDLKTKDGPREL